VSAPSRRGTPLRQGELIGYHRRDESRYLQRKRYYARLPNLLRWLDETAPDVVCLQELKAPQERFPYGAIRDAGYGAIWHGQKSWNGVAILARNSEPTEIRRALPGDADDVHSRYIEATVDGVVIGCLYLPNGNPAPGPKFDYKLRWLDRLIAHAAALVSSGSPVVLAGDYNVIPTERDVYKPERWIEDALFRVEVREAFARLIKQGWTDAIRVLHPTNRSIRSGITFEMPIRATPVCALITCFSTGRLRSGWRVRASIEMYEAGKKRAITHPHGSSYETVAPAHEAARSLCSPHDARMLPRPPLAAR